MRLKLSDYKASLPDFLIVGAAKSGTTSLHKYFEEHPDIFLPHMKETWFFHLNDNPNKEIKKWVKYLPLNFYSYIGLFADAREDQVCGEATPSYLYYHKLTIQNIKKYYPEWKKLKIIIILREPISKVISHYKFVHTKGLDPDNLNLKEALKIEKDRLAENNVLPDLFYVDNTLYYEQVKAYKKTFNDVKIYLFDDLIKKPNKLIKDIYRFVGVDDSFIPESLGKKFNKSNQKMKPKNQISSYILKYGGKILSKLPKNLKIFGKRILLEEEVIESETLNYLKDSFKEDVKQLQQIIDNDISHWIKKYE